MTTAARVAGSGCIQNVEECAGPDALGGTVTAAAHPGTEYPPFPLTEADLPPPGGAQGYVYTPAASVVPATTFFEALPAFNPTSFYGTPNNGGLWGLIETVNLDYDLTRAHWRFNVDPGEPICAALVQTNGSIPPAEGVYDGHPFGDHSLLSYYDFHLEADGAQIVTGHAWNAGILPGSFSSWAWVAFEPTKATQWDLVFNAQLGGGGFAGFHFFGGIDIQSFSLYTGSFGGIVVPASGASRSRYVAI